MIKNRSFLFGLGSGLIIGALLLQLMISGGAAPLTKDQVLQGAARFNLTVIDEASEPSVDETQKDTGDPNGESPSVPDENPVTTPSEPVSAASPSPVVMPEEPDNTNKANPPTKPAEPSAPAKEEIEKPKVSPAPSAIVPKVEEVTQTGMISVHIPNGSTLNETANILVEAGAIQDKNLFLQTANERKINKIIQYGTYSIDVNEKIDSIIDKLITLK